MSIVIVFDFKGFFYLSGSPQASTEYWKHQFRKGLVITIGMLESMWVFTTVERGNFTPNWLRTILFVYDFWHFPGRALNVHCTLRPPPSPKRKTEQQLASFQARLWGFTTILLMNFAPLHFIHWSVKLPTKIVVKLPKVPTTTINVFTSPFRITPLFYPPLSTKNNYSSYKMRVNFRKEKS